MSKASVEHLLKDHHKVLSVLQAFRNFLEVSAEHDRRELWGLLQGLSEGIFLIHEEKEELIVLPELARHGLSWSDGTLAHVRKDHRHGRNLFRNLYQSTHQKEDWREDERKRFVRLGGEWADFLTEHMTHEEELLFPFMDKELTAEQDAALVTQFETLEKEFSEMPDAKQIARDVQDFVERYGSPSL